MDGMLAPMSEKHISYINRLQQEPPVSHTIYTYRTYVPASKGCYIIQLKLSPRCWLSWNSLISLKAVNDMPSLISQENLLHGDNSKRSPLLGGGIVGSGTSLLMRTLRRLHGRVGHECLVSLLWSQHIGTRSVNIVWYLFIGGRKRYDCIHSSDA